MEQTHQKNSVQSQQVVGFAEKSAETADTKTRCIAYDTLIRPFLEYGCEVWDPFTNKRQARLQKTHNKVLNLFFEQKVIQASPRYGRYQHPITGG